MVKARISVGWKNITSILVKQVKDNENVIANISWTPPNVELINSKVFYEININNYKNITVSDLNTNIILGHNNIKFKIRTVYEIINDDEEVLGIAKSEWSKLISVNGVRDKYCENIIKCKKILLNNTTIGKSNLSSKKQYSQAVKIKSTAMSYSGNYNRCGFSLGNIFR